MKEISTQLLLPGGEWLPSLKKAFEVANLELTTQNPRCYRYSFAAQALPIVFEVVRSNDVPRILEESGCTSAAGLSGTDVFTEYGMQTDWIFPLLSLVPSAPQTILYLGLTPNYQGSYPDDKLTGTLYTTYPNISRAYLDQNKLTEVKVVQRGGKIEGLWRANPKNQAIIDISSTGSTAQANDINIYEVIMRPKVALVKNPNIRSQDSARIDDLRERLYLAARRQS